MTRLGTFVATLVVFGCVAAATSYPPVSFNDLVTRADVIFVGDVIDVRAFSLPTRERTIIKTRVTFRVSDPLFGTSGAVEILEFMGGEIPGAAMEIAGMPRFREGERRMVFARRERSANPVVGFTQGVFLVTRDAAGIDRVLKNDGSPLGSADRIGAASVRGGPPETPLALADFRERVRAAVAGTRRR